MSEPAKCLLTQSETGGRLGRALKFQFLLPCPGAFPAASEKERSVSSDKSSDSFPTPSLPGRAQQTPVSEEEKKKGTSRSVKKEFVEPLAVTP